MAEELRLVLVTGPDTEPVERDQVKLQGKCEHAEDDALWDRWIQAAREEAEAATGRALMPQTWKRTLDCFPEACGEIELPKPPLQAEVVVEYLDADGALQTLDPDLYVVDTDGTPGRIYPAAGEVWPITAFQRGAVKVTFDCGYADATAVPARIKQAIAWLACYWNQYRELEGHVPDAFYHLLIGSCWGELP